MNYREAMQYVDELRPLGSVMGLDDHAQAVRRRLAIRRTS